MSNSTSRHDETTEDSSSGEFDEEFKTLQFRGSLRSGEQTEEPPIELETNSPQEPAARTDRLAEIERFRTAALLKAIFPNGCILRSQDDFARFNVFSRLLENIAEFADTGMSDESLIDDVAVDAATLRTFLMSHV